MRTNIVLVQETETMGFSGSLDFDFITSMGETKEEARKNIELIIGDMLLHNELKLEDMKTVDETEYIKSLYDKKVKFILSDIDISDFLLIKDANKSIRTNVSIKNGYKILAKMQKLNISEFLNQELSKKLGVEF